MPVEPKTKLDFSHLPVYQKRRFVPAEALLTDVEQVTGLFEQLAKRSLKNQADLNAWMLDRSELESVLDQEGNILYIRMTCQTDDPQYAKAYQDFISVVVPAVKPYDDQLNKKYLESLQKFDVKDDHYLVYNRALKEDVALFVKENIPLQTDLDLLSQEYQTISGAMTVTFKGKERTMPEMGKFLLEPDRGLREEAWRASSFRRLSDREKFDELFDKMLVLRNKVTSQAKCANFIDYKFRSLHRFDYSPTDCKAYHKTVEEVIVPLWAKILESRRKQMNLKMLKPWDTAVDPLGRAALKPFQQVQQLVEGCQKIFHQLDADLGRQFDEMVDLGLLDLASRKGKAPGGYQTTLGEARKPFIFMNAVGTDSDVRTLLHEAGHAFHSLASAHQKLAAYRHGPMEFNEVASMGMELLADGYLGEFYQKEDLRRSQITHLEDVIFTLVWVATIDCFQFWIYEHPNHTAAERKDAWLAIRQRFGGDLVDWSGLGEEHGFMWQRQIHIFEYPFYYIEYGIAQLGALQLWLNAQKDKRRALAEYRQALKLGGSVPLPQIYRTAGLKFDFSPKVILPLIKAVEKELSTPSL